MLFAADLFLSDLSQNYVLSIAGQKGSGKTAMAFEIAAWYLRRGYKLISNIDNIWQDKYLPILLARNPEYLKHSVLILDEGGRYLREWRYFENIFEFSRKFDNIILIPSTRVAHENLAEFICRPEMWIQRLIPGKFGYWTYTVKTGDKDITGSFYYRPDSSVGVYDTFDVSQSPSFIIEAFSKLIALEAQKRGRSADSVLRVGNDADIDAQAALLRNQKKNFSEFVSLSSRKGRK